MRFFLWILFANLFPLLSMGLFLTWWTALIPFGIMGLIIIIWRPWSHQGTFDDRLPVQRMNLALDRYVEEVNKRRE